MADMNKGQLHPEIQSLINELSLKDYVVARNRFEAITIISKQKKVVLKFVLKRPDLTKKFEQEKKNLIRLENASIVVPKILKCVSLKSYNLIVYKLIEGEVNPNKVNSIRIAQLAKLHSKIHKKLAPRKKPKRLTWDSEVILKPFFIPRNKFNKSKRTFARKLEAQLKKKSNDDIFSFIHSDSHFSNVVFQKNRVVLIDYAEAGFASIYFEIAVVLHALLYQKKSMHKKFIGAYLNSYFKNRSLKADEVLLIENYVKLRFLEAATWHLLESPEDQMKNKKENNKWIESCFLKANSFKLEEYL
jgi:Ser/Thr protein kinase RdoA (MazF antagonist)